jgi:murein DD-endopeptidase MepM/ murein hydrolase activator NlpD
MPTFRSSLLISAALMATACASNPPVPDQAPIDYRTVQPARGTTRAPSQAPASRSIAVAPPPRVVDMGTSPTSSPAVAEAKALAPETGARPGGAMLQPRDNPSARRIEVLPGDTLYDISRRYSVNMRALIETNRLEPPYALNPGSSVYLPPPNVHRVERGETLYAVSRRYNVDTRSLALLNGLARPWTVWLGDELLLPPLARDQSRRSAPSVTQVSAPASPPVRAPQTPKAVPAKTSKQLEVLDSTSGPISLVPGVATPKLPTASPPQREVRVAANSGGPSEFIWPVTGPVLKGFGSSADGIRNDGVNIDVPSGTTVKAAAGGEVVYAGDELVGFGNLILIRHPGGWVTAYAHSDAMLVKEGDLVNQGQSIAKSGATGNAGAPMVHFELRKGKEPVDPAEYLPALKG